MVCPTFTALIKEYNHDEFWYSATNCVLITEVYPKAWHFIPSAARLRILHKSDSMDSSQL